VFVLVNAHAPLSSAVGVPLSVLACVALAAVVAIFVFLLRKGIDVPADTRPAMFGRNYRLVVAGEIVLLVAGFVVFRAVDAPAETGVAWIAFVVGLHFVPFAVMWEQRRMLIPGIALMLLGAAGLAMVATSAVAWTPFVSGVLSGVVLLGGSVTFAAREYLALTRRQSA
jgi:hypothetical protein